MTEKQFDPRGPLITGEFGKAKKDGDLSLDSTVSVWPGVLISDDDVLSGVNEPHVVRDDPVLFAQFAGDLENLFGEFANQEPTDPGKKNGGPSFASLEGAVLGFLDGR